MLSSLSTLVSKIFASMKQGVPNLKFVQILKSACQNFQILQILKGSTNFCMDK